jgi:hypothetical protein
MASKPNPRRAKAERIEHEQRLETAHKNPHRRAAKGDDVLDARLENPLGRLYFHGLISTGEYEAGKRYAEISLEYLQSISAPYPFLQSSEGEERIAGPMSSPSDEECERRKRDYDGAFEALFRCGQRPAVTVKRVAVYDEPTRSPFDFDVLRIGLTALAEYFARGRSNVIPFSRFRPIV